MNAIKALRDHLGLTQAEFAEGIGCTQGNVGHYERGQTVLPAVAARVIAFCASKGVAISYDHLYGNAPIPGGADARAGQPEVSQGK